MKSFDVVGYTADADTYCVDCTKEIYGDDKKGADPKYDHEGNLVHPIFADSETDTPSSCASCGVYIKESLTSDGVEYAYGILHQAYLTNHHTNFMEALATDMAWMNLGEDNKSRQVIIRRYLGEI